MEIKDTVVNIFVGFLDVIRETFETATPSLFAALAAVLPYLSPIPIAWYTASSTEKYLSFTPAIAGIFVFVLEGLGVWATTSLVDVIVDFIRSRNGKTVFMVIFLGVVVVIYVFVLVSLNVSLKVALEEVEPILARIITLMCFIPLLTGVMNGVWKVRLHDKTVADKVAELDERHYQEKQKERNLRWRLRNGYGELTQTYALDTEQVTHSDGKPVSKRVTWLNAERKLRRDADFILNSSVSKVRKKYGVSRKTVTNWRNSLRRK